MKNNQKACYSMLKHDQAGLWAARRVVSKGKKSLFLSAITQPVGSGEELPPFRKPAAVSSLTNSPRHASSDGQHPRQ